jgi:hypothetical protein
MSWFRSKAKKKNPCRFIYDSTYYQKNRDKILEKRRQKYRDTGL